MKLTRKILSLLLCLLLLLSFVACNEEPELPNDGGTAEGGIQKTGVWADATHTEDKTFGTGAKTVTVKVIAEGQSITFTLKTDKQNLADAMLEHDLVAGDSSEFGLYIKKINGITADYNIDHTFWSLSKGGAPLMVGASGQAIADGEHYEFERAK